MEKERVGKMDKVTVKKVTNFTVAPKVKEEPTEVKEVIKQLAKREARVVILGRDNPRKEWALLFICSHAEPERSAKEIVEQERLLGNSYYQTKVIEEEKWFSNK